LDSARYGCFSSSPEVSHQIHPSVHRVPEGAQLNWGVHWRTPIYSVQSQTHSPVRHVCQGSWRLADGVYNPITGLLQLTLSLCDSFQGLLCSKRSILPQQIFGCFNRHPPAILHDSSIFLGNRPTQ
jgi:hypothetical protein